MLQQLSFNANSYVVREAPTASEKHLIQLVSSFTAATVMVIKSARGVRAVIMQSACQ